MRKSHLQDAFMRELADTFVRTGDRILNNLKDALPAPALDTLEKVLRSELQGLYHGTLVVFDGGTALADKGLITIVDDQGVAFERNLHEQSPDHWKSVEGPT